MRDIISNNINTNIRSINGYLGKLPNEEKKELFTRMKDVFYFYGLTGEILKEIIKEGKVPHTYPDKRLPELEGATNAILFQLKYKRVGQYSAKSSENQRSKI